MIWSHWGNPHWEKSQQMIYRLPLIKNPLKILRLQVQDILLNFKYLPIVEPTNPN